VDTLPDAKPGQVGTLAPMRAPHDRTGLSLLRDPLHILHTFRVHSAWKCLNCRRLFQYQTVASRLSRPSTIRSSV